MTGPYADNARNFFDRTHLTSAPIARIVKSGEQYVKNATTRAAGPDEKLSLSDIEKLPKDLQDDMRILMGEKPPDPASRSLNEAVQAADIAELTEYGKYFSVETFPASKTRLEVMQSLTDLQDLTERTLDDGFHSTQGTDGVKAYASTLKRLGEDEKQQAESEPLGDKLNNIYRNIADAAQAEFSPVSKFKNVESLVHTIAEDGDTEFRILLARKHNDGGWLAVFHSNFPF
jgi:hypothetical protein